jgi:manganese oxidase
MRRLALTASLAAALALTSGLLAQGVYSVPGAGAETKRGAPQVRELWIAAVPTTWNIVPTGRDPISGEAFEPSETVIRTVTYRRFSPRWRRPLRNGHPNETGGGAIPGPLIRARVGDRIVVHFKNMDTLRDAPHSMHFHGVRYAAASDGSWIPTFSGPGGRVEPGETFTYRLRAVRGSIGVWPYHDHSPTMMESIEGGMYGAISIFGRREQRPDREFVVFFEATADFQTINGRAFLGNTPVYRARKGERIQWDVLALGSEHHTFHVHGHRWREPDGAFRDTKTIGPADSFSFRWQEDVGGPWLYHCHVEDHMDRGMIGLYRVPGRRSQR